MFTVGDFVVCPGHGVGQVCDIDQREIRGEFKSFFVIKVLANGLKMMIPEDSANNVRGLVETKEIDEVFHLLSDHEVDVDNSTWNRRHREYMQKINTGSLLEIADVLRSLFLLKNVKSLSFGERKMLDLCKELLTKEIALAKGDEEVQIIGKIEACFQ